MATIKHSRTLALQATSPRIVAVPLPINVTADWTDNVTGAGKPADNATINRIQTGTAFIGTPYDGDIWRDTNTTPPIVKTRIGGVWVSAANYTTNTNQLTDGANLGGTATWSGVTGAGKPADYADVTTTIMGASGTSILMTASNLFKSASGLGGVFIGAGGLFGKNGSGVTTFSIDGSTGSATFYGALSGATGTFAGSLSAATGTFAGSLSAATGTFAGSLSAATGSFGAVTAGGAVTVNTSGSISNGIAYGGTGFFLGYSGGAYKFSVGDATKYLRWDGSTLTFTGALSAATGTFSGTLSASSITSGTLTAASIVIPSSAGGDLINIGYSGTIISYRRLSGYNISAGNLSDPTLSAVAGASGSSAAGVYGSSSGAGGHGVRGEAGSGLGFVGYNGGTYDFYASGSATNYGPFTGAHDALVQKGAPLEIGDIVYDVSVAVRKNVSNTICVVALSSAVNQSSAVGVVCTTARTLDLVHTIPAAMLDRFWSYPPDADPVESVLPVDEWYSMRMTHDAITINAVGEGMVNVCGEGGNLQPGDLITTSSIAGKGMRQADDVVRASSVAKCREAVTFDNPDQVRMVACIYLCG